MTLRPKELAIRLGVKPSAISNALARGRLQVDADGRIDTTSPGNAEYLGRFSLHRGKSRSTVATQASPNRVEARRRRARAALERARQRTAARRAAYVHAEFPEAYESGVLDYLGKNLAQVADRVDLDSVNLERALESEVSAVLRDALDHGEAASRVIQVEAKPEPAPINPGETLDALMALLDIAAADRLVLDHEIHSGALIARSEVRHRIGRLGEKLALIRQLPRRYAAQVGAALTDGPDAARSLLRRALQVEADRLKGA